MMVFPWSRSDTGAQVPPGERRRRARGRRVRQEETRRERTSVIKEQLHQRLAWAIGSALILALVGVLAAGYYQNFYRPPRVVAGSVRDVQFTMGDLVQRIRVLQGLSGRVDLSVVPFQYLEGLLNVELLRQAAPGLSIDITDGNIDQALRNQFYPTVPAGQETDPGQLDREFENNYQIFLTRTGLSDQDYRIIMEGELQLQLLYGLLGLGIENTQEQVEVEWVRLETTSELDPSGVRQRLDSEEFAAVAQAAGASAGYADPSGYVGWVPREAFPDLDLVLFGDEESGQQPLGAGEISRPLFTSGGTYIVHKLSGPETRELTDKVRAKINGELVRRWQKDQLKLWSEKGWVKMKFNSELYEWVADQVTVSAPRTQEEQR